MSGTLESVVGISAGVPIVLSRYMAPHTWTMVDGKIITDALATIESALNEQFLKSCGIASLEPPVKFVGELPMFTRNWAGPVDPKA